MENVKILQKLSNYNTYLLDLINAINKQDQNTIIQVFNKIDEELMEIRKKMSVTTERSQKMWNDPEVHFRAVQAEEVSDLRMEFDDDLGLFQLASLINYKPVMTIEFVKMIQILSDIRQRTSIRKERSKVYWSDPESHFKGVQQEWAEDLKNEVTDLMSLYNIAKTSNYTEGIELITSRLNAIAPNLTDSLISKNDGGIRK